MTHEQHCLVETHLEPLRLLVGAFLRSRRFMWGIEYDDLASCARLGLVQAAVAFDPGRSVRFWAFAERRIRGAMLDYLRSEGPMSERDFRTFQVTGVALRSTAYSIDDLAAEHIPLDGSASAFDLTLRAEQLAIVSRLCQRLPAFHRVVVEAALRDDTRKSCEGVLGRSKGRISQIYRDAVCRLRAQIFTQAVEGAR